MTAAYFFVAAILCVINSSVATDASPKSAHWFQTAQRTSDRLTRQPPLFFAPSADNSTAVKVSIDTAVTFQNILGFGGALTQSSATVYKALPAELQKQVIDSYYTLSKGIGYTTGRMPIHSCDFSVDMYTFDDVAGDSTLANFDTEVTYDQNLSLPLIHDALKTRPDLLLFASPWSPPAWMKDNNEMCCGGHLLDEYRSTWALYFSKWITAYKAQGVPVWGVTVQNEPEASQTWESCLYTPEQTRDFVGSYLGPQLQADHPDVKILGFDHNKDHIVEWADTLLGEGSASAEYVDGIAFHWYSGSCFNNVQTVSSSYPDTILLPSEACYELTVLEDDASDESWLVNGTWSKGEGYGYDILGDLESGSAGWTDWNIMLDSDGGPNHVNNFCDAPIIADNVQDGATGEPAIYFHPQYFYMGHFSKFLRPGSTRVQSTVADAPLNNDCYWPYGGCDGTSLHTTAWKVSFSAAEYKLLTGVAAADATDDDTADDDTDASISVLAVVVMNCGSDDKEMSLALDGDESNVLANTVPANSIQTYLIPRI